MAQVYNHIIMPLASRRDQETQIVWGLRDFEYRFGRKAEGMWLAEAAVDTATLELLAEHGLKFTVLAPHQARAVRPLAHNGADVPHVGWDDVSDGSVDPARAYQCVLPSGKTIALFFYDGPISQAVAFEGILRSGERFAQRLVSGFSADRDFPQLLHIATDGETYGHHHKFGDMALAYALHHIEVTGQAKLTNYSQFLELHPPKYEAKISDNSSWSCAHGVERWNSDCGCSSGMHNGWTQQWRRPLRKALDWLRDIVNPHFEEVANGYYTDPWAARNGYINVVLSRSSDTIAEFLASHTSRTLAEAEVTNAIQLMELQRQLMLMYTSCGWFFDELSGLETVQIMQYAARAIQLAEQCLDLNLEHDFITHLEEAGSNIPDHSNGRIIYEKFVRPAKVDLIRVGAHYAVSSLFKPDRDHQQIHAFTVRSQDWKVLSGGLSRLAFGKARVESNVTLEHENVTFAVLHLGDHNLTAGVRGPVSDAAYADFTTQVTNAFNAADLPGVIRLLDQQFFGLTFSLGSLFKDERQAIIDEILKKSMSEAESALRIVFEKNAALMRFLVNVGSPQPAILRALGEFIVGSELVRLLDENVPEPQRLQQLVEDATSWNLQLDAHGVELTLTQAIEIQAQKLAAETDEVHAMKSLIALSRLANRVPFWVNFWQAQNVVYTLMEFRYRDKVRRAAKGDSSSQEWVDLYRELCGQLKVKIDE